MKKLNLSFNTAILLTIVCLACAACGNDAKATTMKLAASEGMVNVSDDKEKDVALIENLPLYSGYQVGTQTDSYAWINLDDTKLTKLDMDSAVHIQKSGTDLEMIVDRGSLFFHITEPLEEETLSIRTSTMSVGIRGTMGWVEAAGEGDLKVWILEGTVEFTVTDADQDAEGDDGISLQAAVSAGEMAELTVTDGMPEIVVTEFGQADVPDFVASELEGLDETLLDQIYALPGFVELAEDEGQVESGVQDTGAEEDEDIDETEEDESEEEHNRVYVNGDSGGSLPEIHSFDLADGVLTTERYRVLSGETLIEEYQVSDSCLWGQGGYEMDEEAGDTYVYVDDPMSFEEFKSWFDKEIAAFEAEHPGETNPYWISYEKQGDIAIAVFVYRRD